MRNKGRIIERDGLFGDVLETVGTQFFNSTGDIDWVSFLSQKCPPKTRLQKSRICYTVQLEINGDIEKFDDESIAKLEYEQGPEIQESLCSWFNSQPLNLFNSQAVTSAGFSTLLFRLKCLALTAVTAES